MDKLNATKYILLKFCDWFYEINPGMKENDNNDLSILKSLKLIFFLCSLDESPNDSILDYPFNKFKALPLGPVEDDVYQEFKKLEFINYKKVDYVKVSDFNLSKDNKDKLDKFINDLKQKNYYLVNKDAFYLVDLSHEWDCWKNNINGDRTITKQDIVDSNKFYSY